jgi:hypothetical protein
VKPGVQSQVLLPPPKKKKEQKKKTLRLKRWQASYDKYKNYSCVLKMQEQKYKALNIDDI